MYPITKTDFRTVVFLKMSRVIFAQIYNFHCSLPCITPLLFLPKTEFFIAVFIPKHYIYPITKLTFSLQFSLENLVFVFLRKTILFYCSLVCITRLLFLRKIEPFTALFLPKELIYSITQVTFSMQFSLETQRVIFAKN